MKRTIVIGLLAFAASGCTTWSLEELRQVTPQGTPFQKALSRYYLEFASSEEKEYDWADSMHFADKGLRAAYGKDVAPESPANWKLPKNTLPEIEAAHAALTEALAAGATESKPEIAARAQYYFDCWLEQQEEAWQEDDIAYCRDGFKDTMDVLSGAPAKPAKAKASKKEAVVETLQEEQAEAPAPKPVKAPEPQAYIVFFYKGEAIITPSGAKAIDDVLQFIEKQDEPYSIVLNGHTDTVGDDVENQKLSEQRAQAVKERLTDGGARERDITIFAFGESDPPVKTGDNVDEPANNRVEIFLND